MIECPRIPGCTFCSSRETCKKCDEGYFLDNDLDDGKCHSNSCFPKTLYNMKIACLAENCASCDDGSACKECNAPFALNENNECQLCEEGTFYNKNDKSCEGISFLKWND